jgi:two-component sensor histidine kinase
MQDPDIAAHLDGSPIVIWAQDADLRYLWIVNPTMGFDEADIIGKTDYDLLDPATAQRVVNVKRKAMETREEVREVVRTTRPEYEETHDLFVRPTVNDGDGQICGISCVSMRVSDETLTLVDEANHRIKNSLAIAQSFLRMQRKDVTDAKARSALMDAEGQLEAVSRFHGGLASGGSHGRINVKDYIENVCKGLADTFFDGGFTVETDVADEEVEGQAALKLALIISELIMNAFKHNHGNGRPLTVRLSYVACGDTRQLIVEDDGVGLPDEFDPQGDTGIGMRIMRVMSRDMGGELHREERGDGARFVFEFPNQ